MVRSFCLKYCSLRLDIYGHTDTGTMKMERLVHLKEFHLNLSENSSLEFSLTTPYQDDHLELYVLVKYNVQLYNIYHLVY